MKRVAACGLAAWAWMSARESLAALPGPGAPGVSAAGALRSKPSGPPRSDAADRGGTSGTLRRGAAGALVDLFTGTCLPHAGDVAGLRAALAARRMAPMPGARARALLVWPGLVFPVALPAQHMAVLSFDNGLCGTIAEDVDAATLLAALAGAMKARGIAVAALGVAPAGAAQAYRLIGPTTRVELMVDIEPSDGRTQASLLAKKLP